MPKPIKTITILGKRYSIKFVPNLGDKYGDCSDPKETNRIIRIRSGLTPEETFITIIHEVLHASDWSKDESWVDEVSSDLARILIRLGYKNE